MADGIAIKVEDVSKAFKLPHEKVTSIKSAVVNLGRKKNYEKQEVLKDVSFEIKQGEFFGIVGRNGSGKSTLLKLLAGIYSPDKGGITINGKLTPFIELGVGFNPELTGRENVFLNGALLGFNRKEMEAKYDDIVAFAELERFMDQKLKNYSSGMQVRLAFSIAIRAKSDILLLDEVLAVGDAIFQKKCYSYFRQLKKEKKTVVFVSHDANALLEYCDKGILIEKGAIVTMDRIDRVVNEYQDILNDQEDSAERAHKKKENRWGVGDMAVKATSTYSGATKTDTFKDADKTVTVKVEYEAQKPTDKPVYGIIITDENDNRMFTTNTLLAKTATANVTAKQRVTVEWEVPNVFNNGTFKIAPAVASSDGTVIYDWIEAAHTFRVSKKLQSAAFINAEHVTKVNQ